MAIKELFPKDYCDRDKDTSHVTLGTKSATDLVQRLKTKFLKEVRNIAKLDHPGIVRIHTAFEENNTAYYVMDYIEGENLSEIVQRGGPLPEQQAIEYIEKVGEALQYIHARRINHLDIKLANIMIRREDDRPILIDFGLSKQYDTEGLQTSTTPTGISHGYAPTEQYNNGGVKEFSPQTDVYSLAATLYFLLSGVVPPQTTKLIDEDLTFPPSIPASLIAPISKGMATSRKQRCESVSQFIAEITRSEDTLIDFEPAEPVKPHPSESQQPQKEKAKKKGGAKKWIGIVAIVAIVVAGAGYMLAPKNNITQHPEEIFKAIDGDTVTDVVEIPSTPKTVTSMFYHSALGDCAYTGEVDDDNKPHGKGIATWTSGDGVEYDGEWVHGTMEGQTHYTQRSGDTFVGIFKANKYHEGTYAIKQNGDYYVGTFKNGQPDKGDWYDKNGNKYE